MKDYEIDITAISNQNGTSAYACKARGTLSERPLFTKAQRRRTASEAALTGALGALGELSSFLSEGDCVDINLNLVSEDPLKTITTGSGNTDIDNEMRKLVGDLNLRGISIALRAAPAPQATMAQQAEMALAFGG